MLYPDDAYSNKDQFAYENRTNNDSPYAVALSFGYTLSRALSHRSKIEWQQDALHSSRFHRNALQCHQDFQVKTIDEYFATSHWISFFFAQLTHCQNAEDYFRAT